MTQAASPRILELQGWRQGLPGAHAQEPCAPQNPAPQACIPRLCHEPTPAPQPARLRRPRGNTALAGRRRGGRGSPAVSPHGVGRTGRPFQLLSSLPPPRDRSLQAISDMDRPAAGRGGGAAWREMAESAGP